MSVRTRFAPSPTGDLHIGGARTALFSWLFARKHKGVFVLRIENTDVERSTDQSIKAILDAMEWLGLDCDIGPLYQTEHFERYQHVTQQLLDADKAYRCYCSKERLAKLREEQMANKQKPRYDGHCRGMPEQTGQSFVVRFRNPSEGVVTFNDQLRGPVTFNNNELDDLIIVRSDGTPTYNFTVVVDDADEKITHVIRGDDHINNTPRQINLYHALGLTPPIYVHVPMILGPDGKRLSKRHGADSVMVYRDQGLLPEAVLNYLARLGWSHGDQEIFSREELIELFDVNGLNKAAAAINPDKLLWLNQHYIKSDAPAVVAKRLWPHMEALKIDMSDGPELFEVVKAQNERCKTLVEMAEKSTFFYGDTVEYEEKAAKKFLKEETFAGLMVVREKLLELEDWASEDAIHHILVQAAADLELKLGKVAQPIRVAVTGGTVSPPLDITLRLLGKHRVIDRLDRAIESIQAG